MNAVEAYALSRTAADWKPNEDAQRMDVAAGVFVVADGIGGRPAGEVASRRAVEMFVEGVARHGAEMPSDDALRDIVMAANRAVLQMAESNPALTGMGSTLSAVVLRGEDAKVVHVGDSKVFRERAGTLEQLTLDFTAEAEYRRYDPGADAVLPPRFSNMLTRAVGLAETIDPQITAVGVEEGDVFILGSDGLTKVLEPDEIASLSRTSDDAGAESLCGALMRLVESRDPGDDVTVGVVWVREVT